MSAAPTEEDLMRMNDPLLSSPPVKYSYFDDGRGSRLDVFPLFARTGPTATTEGVRRVLQELWSTQ